MFCVSCRTEYSAPGFLWFGKPVPKSVWQQFCSNSKHVSLCTDHLEQGCQTQDPRATTSPSRALTQPANNLHGGENRRLIGGKWVETLQFLQQSSSKGLPSQHGTIGSPVQLYEFSFATPPSLWGLATRITNSKLIGFCPFTVYILGAWHYILWQPCPGPT